MMNRRSWPDQGAGRVIPGESGEPAAVARKRRMKIAKALDAVRESERTGQPRRWVYFYARHRDKELARKRKYRRENREKIAESNRRYRQSRKQRESECVTEGTPCST